MTPATQLLIHLRISLAVANGTNANANITGGGVGNVAIANGTNATSEICGSCSNFNLAVANGHDSHASVENGNGNLVFAGSNSEARVENGSLNSATAVCGGSSVVSAQSAQIRVSAPCVGI